MIEVKNTLKGKLNASIVKEYPELEEITITPALEGQELKPNKYGYSKITIKAIPATDLTIEPKTEEQITSGIFKNVTVEAIKGETLNITPTERSQAKSGIFTQVNINPIQVEEVSTDLDFSESDTMELTAQEGKYIKKATIKKDANLFPENIKSGVSIDGIEGNLADTGDADATADDILLNKTAYVANTMLRGTFKPLDTSDATATAEDITINKIAYANGQKLIGTNNYIKTIVSKEEPTGQDRVKVWIQKVKNLIVSQNLTVKKFNNSTKTFSSTANVLTTKSGGAWGWHLYNFTIPTNLLNREMVLSFDGVSTHEAGDGISCQVILLDTDNIDAPPIDAKILTKTKQRYSTKFTPTVSSMYILHYCTLWNTSIVTMEMSNTQLELGTEETEYNTYIEPTVYIKDDVTDEYEIFNKYSDIY